MGIPAEVITWGSLLAGARSNAAAWWLVVVPGVAIFVTVTLYNLLGDGLRDALDPKLRGLGVRKAGKDSLNTIWSRVCRWRSRWSSPSVPSSTSHASGKEL